MAALSETREVEVGCRFGSTLKEVLEIALPTMLGFVLNLLNEMTNTLFIGHTGTDVELAAVGLGNMIQNCISLSVGFGINAALDTLVSQAFGAGQHQLCCHYLQRARILVSLQLVWMVPVLWFSGDFLHAIGQDPGVSNDAGRYNRGALVGLFALFQFEANRKFLMNRRYVIAPALISLVASIFHVLWCWIFIGHFKLGNLGAGFANSTTWWLMLLLSTVYLRLQSQSMGLRWPDVLCLKAEAWREWRPYMQLAVPATIQLCAEWWFWEICGLVVGYFGPVQLAAHVSTMTFVSVAFMPSIGLQMSCATLVGNSLSAGLPRKARVMAWFCTALVQVIWLPIALFAFFGNGLLSSVFTKDQDVRDLAANLFRIYAGVGFFDSAQSVMGGALRGLGKQDIAAGIYMVSFYGVMLPAGCALAWGLHWKVYGVWASFAVGSSLATLLFVGALCRAKWQALAPAEGSCGDPQQQSLAPLAASA